MNDKQKSSTTSNDKTKQVRPETKQARSEIKQARSDSSDAKQTQPSNNQLGTMPVPKLLMQFAVPSIIAMIVGALYNIVDQFFIGQSIGELGNAATNVAFPLTTCCTALSLMMGVGAASAFNLAMGRGDREKALYYIGNAAVLLFTIGLIIASITLAFLEPLLVFFGSPENVLGYAKEYVSITAFGFPFFVLSNGGAHLVRADGSPRYSMMCNLSGAILNAVLDPLLIFGLDMGMTGAALATVTGQIVSALLVARYIRHYKAGQITKEHIIPRVRYGGHAARLGLAQLANHMSMMIVQIVLNNSLTYYGAMSMYGESIPLACAGIINKVNFMFFAVCVGIGQGMQPIVSYNYGAGNLGRVKKAVKLSLIAGSVVCITAFLMFQIFPRQIIGFFGDGSEMYFAFAEKYFRIYMFCTFLNNIQPLASNFFTSIGKPSKATFMAVTRQLICLMPLIVILPKLLGIDGLMFAGPIADFLAAMIGAFMLFVEVKKMNTEDSKHSNKEKSANIQKNE